MVASKRAVLQLLPVVTAMTAGACADYRDVTRAAPGREPASVRVEVRDLDLTTHVGAVTLYRRIHSAARSVCGDFDIVFVEKRAEADRCVDKAMGSAVAKIGNARLTEYYLTKTHHPEWIATAQNSTPER
jgi:UrcA family protein